MFGVEAWFGVAKTCHPLNLSKNLHNEEELKKITASLHKETTLETINVLQLKGV